MSTTPLVPAKYPFADKVNAEIAPSLRLTFEQVYQGALSSFDNDPELGKLIPGTNLLWEDTTEIQSLAYLWYEEGGQVIPDNMQEIMDDLGKLAPAAPWNFSYRQWGLIAGSPADPSLISARIITRTGAEFSGFVIP